jgi:hypothetical protein
MSYALFIIVNQPEREADHSFLRSVEVKNVSSLTYTLAKDHGRSADLKRPA